MEKKCQVENNCLHTLDSKTLVTNKVLVLTGEECGHPGEPANGTLLSSEAMFYPGEQVSYTCNQVTTPKPP